MVGLYVCLFIHTSHISSPECLTLPAWGESPVGVGPSPQVKWRGETGSECCPVKWGFGCPILALTRGSAFRRPQGKREREEGAPQAQENKADVLLVVTQGRFLNVLPWFI